LLILHCLRCGQHRFSAFYPLPLRQTLRLEGPSLVASMLPLSKHLFRRRSEENKARMIAIMSPASYRCSRSNAIGPISTDFLAGTAAGVGFLFQFAGRGQSFATGNSPVLTVADIMANDKADFRSLHPVTTPVQLRSIRSSSKKTRRIAKFRKS